MSNHTNDSNQSVRFEGKRICMKLFESMINAFVQCTASLKNTPMIHKKLLVQLTCCVPYLREGFENVLLLLNM